MSRFFGGGSDSDRIDCGTTTNTVFKSSSPCTIVLWFKPYFKNNGNQELLSRTSSGGVGPTLRIQNGTGSVRFLHAGATPLTVSSGNGAYGLGIWHSLALKWDGSIFSSNAQIFIDLKEIVYSGNSDGATLTDNSPNIFVIGNNPNFGNAFHGEMAHVQMFSGVLSLQQIAQVTWYPGSIRTFLQGYWPLYGFSNPEKDYAPRGLHGVVTGTVQGFSEPPICGIITPRVSLSRFPYTTPAVDVLPVFDVASSSGYEPALSTYSWNHTVANKSNRVLVVGVGIFLTGTVTSVKFNGKDLLPLRADTQGIYRSELWYMVAPDVGTFSVQVTLNASLTSIGNAQSYYGVDQTNPIDAHNGNNGTNNPASASVVTIQNKDIVVGNLVAQTASGVTSAGGQNSRTANNGALGTDDSDDTAQVTPPASTTLTWNGIGLTDGWAVSLAALSPVLGSASNAIIVPPKRKKRLLMEVGL